MLKALLKGSLLSLVLSVSAMAADTEMLVPQEFGYAGQKVFAYGRPQSEVAHALTNKFSSDQIFFVTSQDSYVADNVLNLVGQTTFVARDIDMDKLMKNLSRFKFNGYITACEPDGYMELQEAHVDFMQLNDLVSSMNPRALSASCSNYNFNFGGPNAGGAH